MFFSDPDSFNYDVSQQTSQSVARSSAWEARFSDVRQSDKFSDEVGTISIKSCILLIV